MSATRMVGDLTSNQNPGDDEDKGEKEEDRASSACGVHSVNSLYS
jgi:hypothetical protein